MLKLLSLIYRCSAESKSKVPEPITRLTPPSLNRPAPHYAVHHVTNRSCRHVLRPRQVVQSPQRQNKGRVALQHHLPTTHPLSPSRLVSSLAPFVLSFFVLGQDKKPPAWNVDSFSEGHKIALIQRTQSTQAPATHPQSLSSSHCGQRESTVSH
jgi:hypothetical protein